MSIQLNYRGINFYGNNPVKVNTGSSLTEWIQSLRPISKNGYQAHFLNDDGTVTVLSSPTDGARYDGNGDREIFTPPEPIMPIFPEHGAIDRIMYSFKSKVMKQRREYAEKLLASIEE